jgi:hypothetical protein
MTTIECHIIRIQIYEPEAEQKRTREKKGRPNPDRENKRANISKHDVFIA